MSINHAMRGQFNSFLKESNRIEGIHRPPTDHELAAFEYFLQLDEVTVWDLRQLVEVFQPGAIIRSKFGLDVRVGAYVAPPGGPHIVEHLTDLLRDIEAGLDPWTAHCRYESLHPFTDGNGRSGRALWAWQMGPFKLGLGFLHAFYYQTLSHSEGR